MYVELWEKDSDVFTTTNNSDFHIIFSNISEWYGEAKSISN
jgi:hypothetical protein